MDQVDPDVSACTDILGLPIIIISSSVEITVLQTLSLASGPGHYDATEIFSMQELSTEKVKNKGIDIIL